MEIEKLKLLLETERFTRKQEKKELEKAKHDKDRYAKRITELEKQLKNAIVPKLKIGQKVFMIPTQFNGLQTIVEYLVFTYELSSLGIRIGLSIKEKQKGVESIYSATEEMIGSSIFISKEEAEIKLKEIYGGDYGK